MQSPACVCILVHKVGKREKITFVHRVLTVQCEFFPIVREIKTVYYWIELVSCTLSFGVHTCLSEWHTAINPDIQIVAVTRAWGRYHGSDLLSVCTCGCLNACIQWRKRIWEITVLWPKQSYFTRVGYICRGQVMAVEMEGQKSSLITLVYRPVRD